MCARVLVMDASARVYDGEVDEKDDELEDAEVDVEAQGEEKVEDEDLVYCSHVHGVFATGALGKVQMLARRKEGRAKGTQIPRAREGGERWCT